MPFSDSPNLLFVYKFFFVFSYIGYISYSIFCCFALQQITQQSNVLCLDPSAADLIALFLYQADVASNIAREIVSKENASVNGTQPATDSSAQYDGSLLFILECFL